jgi:hypothetical protein
VSLKKKAGLKDQKNEESDKKHNVGFVFHIISFVLNSHNKACTVFPE